MLGVTNVLIAVVFFAALVPLLVLPWIHHQYRRYGRLRGWSAVVAAAEGLYLCGLVAFTLFPLPTAYTCAGVNIDPLNDLAASRAAIPQVALNVLLFVPLGFFLRYRFGLRLGRAIVAGLGVSLIVETVQGTAVLGLFPCPYRVADTGDLLTNTMGTAVGALFAALVPAFAAPFSRDVGRPGLLRRGLAVGADLLIGYLGAAAVVIAGVGDRPGGLLVVVLGVVTLVVPLARRDRATLGQATFFLVPEPGRAVVAVCVRYLVWWLPVSVVVAGGHPWTVAGVALVIGLLARLRGDRRSVLEVLTGAAIVTRAAARAGSAVG
ncbi:VanZ family protein [Actinoplanes missouriensis]|uniref:VanZ family protein n=1 Tax=Actinoplanes missouriensis TaxID=1866 RepID=UPI0033DB57E0